MYSFTLLVAFESFLFLFPHLPLKMSSFLLGCIRSYWFNDFSSHRISYVDRGFIFGLAHIRGGMDLGRHWYENGKMEHKENTFRDFISCCDHLASEGFTSKGKITAIGGSAGGMLMGVLANKHPEYFSSIIAHVPFVDVLTTMLDDTLPLTKLEYNEWGNPNIKDEYLRMKSYSPYDNIQKQGYPHMLIVCGLNDTRVTYWEPAKWAAKLRDNNTSKNVVLLKTHMESGHGGASGRYDYLKEYALDVVFAEICRTKEISKYTDS